MKISYPKFTREESLNCKLSDKDIANIRDLRKKNWTLKALAFNFSVSPATIRYWTNENARQKNIMDSIARNKNHKESYKKSLIKHRRRKRLLQREELNKYDNSLQRNPSSYNFLKCLFLKIHKEDFKKFRQINKFR